MGTRVLNRNGQNGVLQPDGLLVWIWATAIFFTLGIVWSVATPTVYGPDEAAHVVRAAGVWNGTVNGTHQRIFEPRPEQGEDVTATGVVTNLLVPQAYDELRTLPDCYLFKPSVPANCAPPVSDNMTPTLSVTYVGTYQPTYYLLVGWPSRLFSPSTATYAMRFVSVAIGAALIGSGLLSALRATKNRKLVLGAALAMTPMTLFLMGTVNPSGLEITAAFATWLGFIELSKNDAPPTRSTIARVTVAAALFGMSRPLSPAFVALAAVLVVMTVAPKWDDLRSLASARAIQVAAGILVFTLAVSSAWVLKNHAFDAFSGVSQPGLSSLGAARQHVEMLPFRARQLIGRFGYADAPLPDLYVWTWLTAIGVVVSAALWKGTMRQRLGLIVVIGATMTIPLLSEITKAKEYGFIWQGRYSLPFAIGVPILAAWIIAQVSSTSRRWQNIGAGAVATLTSFTMVIAHLTFMTRVSIGNPNPVFEYLSNPIWIPPISSRLLLFLTILAACAYFAFIAMSTMALDKTHSTAEVSATS